MKFSSLLFILLLSCTLSQFLFHTVSYPDTVSTDHIDLIIFNGSIYTMENSNPTVESIAIQGNTIFKLGSISELLTYADSNTKFLDLQGATLFPGFIDSHSHWIGDRALVGNTTALDAIDYVLRSGWTSISELFVNQDRLNELISLASTNSLKIRVNGYMPLSWHSDRFGNWYQDYTPGFEYTDHFRIGGVKIFLDNFPNNTLTLWFNQSEFTSLITEASDLGYQIAVHSISSNATDIALNSFEQLLVNDSNLLHRHRIEHLLEVRTDQIQRLNDLDLLASIQLTWLNSDWNDYLYIYTDNNLNSSNFGRWKDIIDSGVKTIGSTDFPWTEGPIGSIQNTIYSAVTRNGLLNNTPTDFMLNQRLTVDQVLKSITIDAAYGTFQEDVKGSIKVNKLADFVLLNKNPYVIAPNDLLTMEVIASIIGGTITYCNPIFTTRCIPSLEQPNSQDPSSTQFSSSSQVFSSTQVSTSSSSRVTLTTKGFEFLPIIAIIPIGLLLSKKKRFNK
jgi:predicted amidohydrolase YtcJ